MRAALHHHAAHGHVGPVGDLDRREELPASVMSDKLRKRHKRILRPPRRGGLDADTSRVHVEAIPLIAALREPGRRDRHVRVTPARREVDPAFLEVAPHKPQRPFDVGRVALLHPVGKRISDREVLPRPLDAHLLHRRRQVRRLRQLDVAEHDRARITLPCSHQANAYPVRRAEEACAQLRTLPLDRLAFLTDALAVSGRAVPEVLVLVQDLPRLRVFDHQARRHRQRLPRVPACGGQVGVCVERGALLDECLLRKLAAAVRDLHARQRLPEAFTKLLEILELGPRPARVG